MTLRVDAMTHVMQIWYWNPIKIATKDANGDLS